MSRRRWCPICGRRGQTTSVRRKFETRAGVAMVVRVWSHLDYHGGDPKDCAEVRTAERDEAAGPWGRSAA